MSAVTLPDTADPARTRDLGVEGGVNSPSRPPFTRDMGVLELLAAMERHYGTAALAQAMKRFRYGDFQDRALAADPAKLRFLRAMARSDGHDSRLADAFDKAAEATPFPGVQAA